MSKLLFFLLASTLSAVLCQAAHAQNPSAFFEEVNNSGREFFLTFPPCIEETETRDSNTCVLFIFGDKDQEVTVEVASKGYSETRFLKAFEVEKWELSPDIAQVYRHFDDTDIVADSLFAGAAVHVLAEHRVVVNVETRFGKRQASYTALPADILSMNQGASGGYFIQAMQATRDKGSERILPSQLSFVGIADSTFVTITLGRDTIAGTTGDSIGLPVRSFWLNRGDVHTICFENMGSSPSGATATVSSAGGQGVGRHFALVGSGYHVAPQPSQEFDFGAYQCEIGFGSTWLDIERIDAFRDASNYIQFASSTELSHYQHTSINGVNGSFNYRVQENHNRDFVAHMSENNHATLSGALIGSETTDSVYRLHVDAYPSGSQPTTQYMFHISDQFSTTSVVHIANFNDGDEPMEVFRFNELSAEWLHLATFGKDDLEQQHQWLATRSTTLNLSPGVYYTYGPLHMVFSEHGEPLARQERRGGCTGIMPSNSYKQQGHTITGVASFGCNVLSRIYLDETSINCSLRVIEHDYTRGNIYYELIPTDTTKSCEAKLISLSLNSEPHESNISWKPISTDVDEVTKSARILVAPHPATDAAILHVNLPTWQEVTVTFVDVHGRVVSSHSCAGTSLHIPTPDFSSPGLATAIVTGGGLQLTHTFILGR